MNNSTLKIATLASLIAGLLACGGGGGGGTDTAGIGGTGITTTGTITGFGSIYVNGIEFETDSATIEVDDNNRTQSALRVGMVVKVLGTVNNNGTTGNATSVHYDGNLEGPIATAPTANADNTEISFTVLGTTVTVSDTDTVFSGTNFSGLSAGDMIDVSGFYDASGNLIASYLRKKSESFVANTTEVEAKGTISNLAGSNFTLTIASGSSLAVNASSANLSDIPNGSLANGQFVEVKGTLPAASSTNLTATEVEYEDFEGDEDNVSIEGIVTDYVSLGNFKVAGTQVDASSAELDPTNLNISDGIEVEVEGALVNGTLIATEVEDRGGNIEIQAPVSATGNNSVTVSLGDGTLTITVDNQTRMEDDVLELSPFGVSDINPGDFLEIEAFEDASSNLIASRIKRDSNGDIILQGIVDSFTDTGGGAGSVTILGITFTTTVGTDFEDSNDNNIVPKDDFFDSGTGGTPTGDLVKIQDNDPADGIADEVEFED